MPIPPPMLAAASSGQLADLVSKGGGSLPGLTIAGSYDELSAIVVAVLLGLWLLHAAAGFVWGCRARNVGFAVVARSNAQISAAISRAVADAARWSPALRQDGEARPGAAVAEVTDLVDLDRWPPGTRLVVRREPAAPRRPAESVPGVGAPLLGHTDNDGDHVTLDVAMSAHAREEDNIRRLRDSGFERFPFVDLDANRAWLAEVCIADALVRWFQLLCMRRGDGGG